MVEKGRQSHARTLIGVRCHTVGPDSPRMAHGTATMRVHAIAVDTTNIMSISTATPASIPSGINTDTSVTHLPARTIRSAVRSIADPALTTSARSTSAYEAATVKVGWHPRLTG